MKKALASLTLTAGLLSLNACGRMESPAENSTVKFDIDVDKSSVNPLIIKELLIGLGGFVHEGRNSVPLADVLGKVTIQGGFKQTLDKIVSSRDEFTDVTCVGRKCHVISLGDEFSFVLEGVKIPVLGTPTLQLAKRIEIDAVFSEDGQKLEACKMVGIKAKTGILTSAAEGALIEVVGDVLKTLKVDVGAAGTYPNNSCVI